MNKQLRVNTVLYTKDGRNCGNAIIVALDDNRFVVKTDYGTEFINTEDEVMEFFYPDFMVHIGDDWNLYVENSLEYPHKNMVK